MIDIIISEEISEISLNDCVIVIEFGAWEKEERFQSERQLYVFVCVCVYIYIYIYVYTHFGDIQGCSYILDHLPSLCSFIFQI